METVSYTHLDVYKRQAYDAFTKDPVKEDSERIYVILREKGKTEKGR